MKKDSLPKRFHIGTQRAASTYLYNLLNSHPDITLSPMGEVNFFSGNFKKGEEWYYGAFPKGPNKVDTSPTYFKYGGIVAERVRGFFGKQSDELRFLVILRNPIDYISSHFNLQLSQNYFKKHPKAYPRTAEDIFEFLSMYPEYARRGEYAKLLGEWLEHFKREQFLVVSFEDLTKETDRYMRKILSFWDIPYKPLNAGTISKNTALRFSWLRHIRGFITKRSGLKDFLKKRKKLSKIIEKYLTRPTAESLSQKDRDRLREIFKDDVSHLKKEFKFDTSCWKDFSA